MYRDTVKDPRRTEPRGRTSDKCCVLLQEMKLGCTVMERKTQKELKEDSVEV